MSGFTYHIDLKVSGGSAISRLASQTAGFETAVAKAGRATSHTSSAIQRLGQKAATVFNDLKEAAGGFLGTLTAIGGGVGLVKLASDMEQTNLSFDVMLGNADKAKSLIGDLNHFANVTPFSNSEVLQAGRNLVAFGFDAQSVIPNLRMVGDVASGLQIPFGELSNIFGKMKTRGIVQAEELELFTDRGIPIIGAFSKVLNVAERDVYDMAKKSRISFDDMTKAFQMMTGEGGQFHKMMERQAETFGGKWSTFVGTVEQFGISIGTQLLPPLTDVLNKYLIPGVEWMSRHVTELTYMATAVGIVAVAYKTWAFWTGVWTAVTRTAAWTQLLFTGGIGTSIALSKVATFVTGGFSGAMATLNAVMRANPIGLIITALGLLATWFAYSWNHSDTFRGRVMGLWEVCKEFGSIVWDWMVAPLMALGKVLVGIWNFDYAQIAEGVTDGANAIKKVLDAPDRLANAMNRGWNDGTHSFNAENMTDPTAAFYNERDDRQGALGKFANKHPKEHPNGVADTSKTKAMAEGITGGGQKNVTISISKVTGIETVHTTNFKGSAQSAGEEVLKMLLQYINGANQVQVANG